MNLSGVVMRFATGPYAVTRRAASTYVNGRIVEQEPQTLTIKAVVQPVSGRELERLPEGLRDRELISLWTTEPLQGGANVEPDSVAYRGGLFEVQGASDWHEQGAYWQSVAARVGP